VTTDGHAGALKAIRDTWPTAQIQRCLVHVKRNIQQDVGLNPTLNSGKVLRWLSLQLLKVDTRAKAAAWTAKLHEFEHTYGT
jgi:transposase-like protein